MQIITKRLLLRPFTGRDWPALHRYLSDPQVVRFEPYGCLPPRKRAAKPSAAHRAAPLWWCACAIRIS